MNKIYSTTIINTGGRAGEVYSPDKTFSHTIAAPGSDVEGATNPEQLFAAGYSACFNSALELVMRQDKIREKSTITATVTLYEQGAHDYIIGVDIEGHIDNISKEQTEALLAKAHTVCPYSKATAGNIEVNLSAV